MDDLPDGWTTYIGVAVVVIVGLSLFGVVVGGGSGPDQTVEDYWSAIDDGDAAAANEYQTSDAPETGEIGEVTAAAVDISVSDVEVLEQTDGRATVDATIEMDQTGGGSVTYDARHRLEKVDGEWRIDTVETELTDISE